MGWLKEYNWFILFQQSLQNLGIWWRIASVLKGCEGGSWPLGLLVYLDFTPIQTPTERFGNQICFRPQVERWSDTYQAVSEQPTTVTAQPIAGLLCFFDRVHNVNVLHRLWTKPDYSCKLARQLIGVCRAATENSPVRPNSNRCLQEAETNTDCAILYCF